MTKRIPQIDALKGFAICLVIMGHVIYWSDMANYSTNLLFIMIYTFHVPLFFFVSGYLTYNRFGPMTLPWINKKFIGLMIPYIIFTVFYFHIIPGAFRNQISIENLINNIFSYTKNDSAWFLPILFQSFVGLSIIINIERIMKKYTIFFNISLILFIIISPLIPVSSMPGGSLVIYYSIYVVIGYYSGKYSPNIYSMLSGKSPYIIYSLYAIGSLLFPLLFMIRSDSLVNNLYFKFSIAFAGIIFSILIIKLFSKSRIFSLFTLCGVYSMELYLIHLIIGNYFSYRMTLWFGSEAFKIFSGTLVILALSLTISYIVSYNKKISQFLFGRWAPKYAPENQHQILYVLIFTIGLSYILSLLM